MEDKSETEIKTMWSESLLEGLYVALKKSKDDSVVKDLLNEIKEKDYDNNYIINKVKRKVGPTAAERVNALLSDKSGSRASEPGMSKADIARANAAKKKANAGILGKIKAIFGSKIFGSK